MNYNPLYERNARPAAPDEWAPTKAALNVSRDIIDARRQLWELLARGLYTRGGRIVPRWDSCVSWMNAVGP